MMLLQNHQQLDILREEDLSMMTSSGDVNLYSADFRHPPTNSTGQPPRASSAHGAVEYFDNNQQQPNDCQNMKTKRKTSVFSKLGGYKFKKSVPQCRKEVRSSSWTAIPGDVTCFVLPGVDGLQKNSESLCDGLMIKHQDNQHHHHHHLKQVFSGLTRNSSLSIAKSKSNSLPIRASYDSNPFERQDGNKAFQHESDTADDSDGSEGADSNQRTLNKSNSSGKSDNQVQGGSMRWKKMANKLGIDSIKKAFKEGLTSPSNPNKSIINNSKSINIINNNKSININNNNSPSHSNNSSGSNLLAGMEMADSNCSIAMSAPDSFSLKPLRAPQHVRRASLAVECMREASSSSSSSPFLLLSSSSSSLQQQQQNYQGQLGRQQQDKQQQSLIGNSQTSNSTYDSDSDSVRDQTLKSKHWQHRNSFQSVLPFSQQQHLLQLQIQQQQLQNFHESLLKIAALDVTFLSQSEAEAWSLTVPPSTLATLSGREIKFQNHVWELIQTEKNHLRTLLTMQKVFVEGLMEEVKMTEKMIDTLFPALHDLIFFHYSFLTSLVQLQASTKDKFISQIGPTLITLFSGRSGKDMKEVYGNFCAKHSEALQMYKESLKNDINFQRFIKKCSCNPLCKRLTVPECILLVAQRPTKYPLLIEPILETAPKSTPEHESLQRCLSYCRSVLDEINQEIDSKSKSSKLVEICGRIDSKSSVSINGQVYKKSDIFGCQRRLVMEGGAKLVINKNKQQDVYMVLLSDVIILLSESGQKLNFFNQENKSSLISLKSLLIRDKADSRDYKGLYLICSSDTPIPEMVELSFKSPEERNRWSCAIREAISLNPQKNGENVNPGSSLVRCTEATPLVGQSSDLQAGRKVSALDEATIVQLQSLVDEMRVKDSEICHLLNEKLKTVSTITNILSTDNKNHMVKGHNASLQDWINIAFAEGTKLLGLSTLSPNSLGSVDSCLSHDFEDLKGETVTGDTDVMTTNAMATDAILTILPKRAETFAGFDSRKTLKEGNIMARPSSATLNKKMATAPISKCQIKDYDQCITSSSAMQNSICSTTSGVRSSSFEGQSSSFEGHVLSPSQCSSVGKLLSAIQKISVQAMSQMTEIQSLNIQLAETRTKSAREGNEEFPSSSSSSSSSSFCQNDDVTLNIEVSSLLCTTSLGTTSGPMGKTASTMAQTTISSPPITTVTCISSVTMVTSFSTISPPLVSQERVKVVRPTFLPFSPLKFQPLYPRKLTKQVEERSDGVISGSSSFPLSSSSSSSSSTTCSSMASSSLPSTPQTVSNRNSCQSFPRKSCKSDPGCFAKIKAVDDLTTLHEDETTFKEDEPKSVLTPFVEEFLSECILETDDMVDNHLNISDSQITILVDSCPETDESTKHSNRHLIDLNIEESKTDNISCCKSCIELFDISTSSSLYLNKSRSVHTIDVGKAEIKNDLERKEETKDLIETPTSLSLYFK